MRVTLCALQLAALTETLERETAAVNALEANVAGIEKQILEAGGVRVAVQVRLVVDDDRDHANPPLIQRSRVSEMQQALDELRAGVVASEVSAKAAAAAAAKATARLANTRAELAAAEKQVRVCQVYCYVCTCTM
jgi:hypothetical protein